MEPLSIIAPLMKSPVFKLFPKETPHWLTYWNIANYNPSSIEITQQD